MMPAHWRTWLWYVVPAAVLVALLGVEIDWGRHVHFSPDPSSPVDPKPLAASVLPEYQVEGGLGARTETVQRTLFNPTRRPAPALAADGGKRQMQHGQFTLAGTTVTGDRSIAFLREVPGGKSRAVRQGEQLNGMLVAK